METQRACVVFIHVLCVCMCPFLRVMLVPIRACCGVCICVCVRDSGREEKVRDRGMPCANPYSLWRIQGHPFMFCQPSVNQFPIKVMPNSAVIPISSSRFHYTVSEALKQFSLLLSDLLQVCPTRLAQLNLPCQAL